MAETYDDAIIKWTQKVLDKRGLSLRAAEITTRGEVSYSTIQNMLKGKRVQESLVIKFAIAFGEDVADALRLFGYDSMANIWETGAAEPPTQPQKVREPGVVYEVVEDGIPEFVISSEGIEDTDKARVMELIANTVKTFRRTDELKTFGKRVTDDE